MDKDLILAGVREAIISVLGHGSFEMRDDLTAADVPGWDSLTHMSIIIRIEKHFGVKFKLKEINKLKNLGSLIELVASKLKQEG